MRDQPGWDSSIARTRERFLAELCERFEEKAPGADRTETAGFLPLRLSPNLLEGLTLAQCCEHLFRREHGSVARRLPRSSEIQSEDYFPLSPKREILCSPAEILDQTSGIGSSVPFRLAQDQRTAVIA